MTDQTIVGIFDSEALANAAVAELRSSGVPERTIAVHTETSAASGTGLSTGSSTGSSTGIGTGQPGFWAGVLGGAPDHGTEVYSRSLQGGAVVVAVQSDGTSAARIMDILEKHNPVDVDERAAGYGVTQAASGQTVQLAEEQLQVGKRVVNRGGTRIRRYVVETPVEQSVSLHSEEVRLERRPVTDGRAPTDSFGEKTLEVTTTAEEAVVAKTASVYEEVALHKEMTERVQTVRDSVRKEQVAVEPIPAVTTDTATRR